MTSCEKILVERGLAEGRFTPTRAHSTRARIRDYVRVLRRTQKETRHRFYVQTDTYTLVTDCYYRARRSARQNYLNSMAREYCAVYDNNTGIALYRYE